MITVNKVRRPKNKTEEREAGKFLNDKEQSDWETGKLGRDVKHMKPTDITLSVNQHRSAGLSHQI